MRKNGLILWIILLGPVTAKGVVKQWLIALDSISGGRRSLCSGCPVHWQGTDGGLGCDALGGVSGVREILSIELTSYFRRSVTGLKVKPLIHSLFVLRKPGHPTFHGSVSGKFLVCQRYRGRNYRRWRI